jgi:hypothetical protein
VGGGLYGLEEDMMTWVRRAMVICATLGVLFTMTGCGVLGAMANPKVAWAIKDPAPMTVVVRRADAAEDTAKQVDRLLTATPASPDADWLKNVGPKPEDSAQDMKALTQDPAYAQSHARVVAAEVWLRMLGDLQSTAGSSPSLLGMVSTDLSDQYALVTAKEAEVAQLDAQIAAEKEARDAKGVTDADKKAHEQTISDLKSQKSKKEDEVDPLRKKVLASVKDAAAKTPSDTRDAVGPALVNLRQAVDDASIADGAAAVRYPLAVTSMLDSVKQMVPVFVADIIEEQTGKRPKMNGFQPSVSLDGMTPQITLNGLTKDDMGKISLGDLTTQTVDRTKKWVVHALGLLGSISSTKDELSFEEDTLDALLDGFAKNGWKRVDAAKIPEMTDPKVMTATAKVRPHVKPVDKPAIGVADTQAAKPAPTPAPASPATKTTTKKPVASNKPATPAAPATPAPTTPAQPPKPALPQAPMRLEDFKP